ncbi:MAG: ATP-binding cassette domain-containing protein [Bacillota bacterium]|nr:ATP-binding cassette domain-containing protein [Bacillota bacterium]
MLALRGIGKTFNPGTVNEKTALHSVNLYLKKGDYVTVIGGNGSGKSTLLNCIAGVHEVDCGSVIVDKEDLTKCSEHKRAKVLGRVFQDPMVGTSARMSIEENLALANRRGLRRTLARGIASKERVLFKEALSMLDLGLEDRLTTQVGLLSGGQRQALTLLMATLRQPKLLLLDEHTAALDPKTAEKVLDLSDRIIKENELTALMVTHNMRDAIKYGNRLIMMHDGNIVLDIKGEAKQKLTVEYLLNRFGQVSGQEFTEDRALLA